MENRWTMPCDNRKVRSNLRHDANRYVSTMHSTTEMATMHLDLEVRSRKSSEKTAPTWILPRKEVIQPHLPVRLPCYDFTPITNPTLDVCLYSEE